MLDLKWKKRSMSHIIPVVLGTTGARPDLLADRMTPPPPFSEVVAGARPRTHTSPLPTGRLEDVVR